VLVGPLVEATLIKRYKRFLCDVRFADGTEVTAHCPNPGSMLGVAEPGSRIFLSESKAKNRKLAWTWRFVEVPGSLVCVDTMLANKLFREAFESGVLTELAHYEQIKSEYNYEDCRFDFYLSGTAGDALVEVKSTTLVGDVVGGELSAEAIGAVSGVGVGEVSRLVTGGASHVGGLHRRALFPDARTERGLKHLTTLSRALANHNGERALECVQFYLIARSDTHSFAPADAIDPKYGAGLRAALSAGVRVLTRELVFELKPSGSDGSVYDLEIGFGRGLPVVGWREENRFIGDNNS
jgi:sugar fermentation stimulation protein A